jgi:hypothetical protein
MSRRRQFLQQHRGIRRQGVLAVRNLLPILYMYIHASILGLKIDRVHFRPKIPLKNYTPAKLVSRKNALMSV